MKTSRLLRDYYDGSFFKKRPLKTNEHQLDLLLYGDDFCVVNPLKKTKTQKFTVIMMKVRC